MGLRTNASLKKLGSAMISCARTGLATRSLRRRIFWGQKSSGLTSACSAASSLCIATSTSRQLVDADLGAVHTTTLCLRLTNGMASPQRMS